MRSIVFVKRSAIKNCFHVGQKLLPIGNVRFWPLLQAPVQITDCFYSQRQSIEMNLSVGLLSVIVSHKRAHLQKSPCLRLNPLKYTKK